jgi:hypothetical protein
MELTIKCPKCGRQGAAVSRDGKLMRHAERLKGYPYNGPRCDASGTQAPPADVDAAIASEVAHKRRCLDGVDGSIADAKAEFDRKVAVIDATRVVWEGELAALEKLAAKRAKAAAKGGAE